MAVRPIQVLFLIALGLEATSAINAYGVRGQKDHPVTDAMEGIGNTAGTVQDGTASATGPVTGPVGDAGGSVVTGAGDTVVNTGNEVGGDNLLGDPKHVKPIAGGTIPTALVCTINLTIQYLGVYTALAILRVVAEFKGENPNSWTIYESLGQAVLTVNYAPMSAILFLACRMRVTWLTQGQGNPPIWMQAWMYYATFSVLALTLVALVVPLLTGEKVKFNDKGDIDE